MSILYDPQTGQAIPICIRYSGRAKRIRLVVQRNRSVELVLPKSVRARDIPGIVQQHQDWIANTLNQIPLLAVPGRPLDIALPAIAQHWTVHYQSSQQQHLQIDYEAQQLVCPDVSLAELAPLLTHFVKNLARQYLQPRLEGMSESTGLRFNKMTIRNQKTRWGSCSRAGAINLNCRLLFLPKRIADYVLLHELCHTVHLNHSSAFWQLVARHEPDYRVLDRALKQHEATVPDWCRNSI